MSQLEFFKLLIILLGTRKLEGDQISDKFALLRILELPIFLWLITLRMKLAKEFLVVWTL